MPLSDMQQKYHYLFIDIINSVALLLTLSSYGFETNVTTWLYFFFFSKYICSLILLLSLLPVFLPWEGHHPPALSVSRLVPVVSFPKG